MYNINGFRPVYGKTGNFAGVQAGIPYFEVTEFKVWFGNIKRRLFVNPTTGKALFHYSDLTHDNPQYWYSLDSQDWNGVSRISAKQLADSMEQEAKENA
jgi:hypothetical protein